MSGPRIALIHATPVAIDPVADAFARLWPEAEIVNLLDDSLSADRARLDTIDEALSGRIEALAAYAMRTGCAGILFTCSAFGEPIERVARALDIPVLKPNEAMFDAALESGGTVAMLYTFAPAREGMEREFGEQARHAGADTRLESIGVKGAIEALRRGDGATHDRLVADAAQHLDRFSAVMLAHFSTARAADAVRQVTSVPVLTSPDAAVLRLKSFFKRG